MEVCPLLFGHGGLFAPSQNSDNRQIRETLEELIKYQPDLRE
jgi:hypothetical protein